MQSEILNSVFVLFTALCWLVAAFGAGTETNLQMFLLWQYSPPGNISASPAVGDDGTIYFGTGDGSLCALNPDGTNKWEFKTLGGLHSPSIGPDGTIYVGSDDTKFYAINPDGTKKWRFITGGGVSSTAAIGDDGTIYFGSSDNILYALNPDGSMKWKFATAYSVNSPPAIGTNGIIYVTSLDHRLYAINPNGTKIWDYEVGDWIYAAPVISFDGTISAGSLDHKMYAINPNGILKWSFRALNSIANSAAIGFDGTVYFGCADSMLYALASDGSLKWQFETGLNVDTPPAIDEKDNIYFASNDGKLYCLNREGAKIWEYQPEGHYNTGPVITADKKVLFSGSKLYAFQGLNSLSPSAWPMYCRDQKHTSRALPAIPVSTSLPVSQTLKEGSTVSFTASVIGQNPLFYQWLKDGTILIGETNSIYRIISTHVDDSGVYSVLVTNRYGGISNIIASLTVWKHMDLDLGNVVAGANGLGVSFPGNEGMRGINPDNGVFAPYSTGTYSYTKGYVSPTSSPFVDGAFVLYPNEVIINNYGIRYRVVGGDENTAMFNYIMGGKEDNGLDPLIINDTIYERGIGISASSGVTFNLAAMNNYFSNYFGRFYADYGPRSSNINTRGYVVFSNKQGVIADYVSAWTNRPPYPGTEFNLRIPPNAEFMTLMVGCGGNGIENDHAGFGNAFLYSSPEPFIYSQPADLTVTNGDVATLNVVVTGQVPMCYQWMKDGINIVGETNTTLILSDTKPTQAGNYPVMVTNSAGSAISVEARLGVQVKLNLINNTNGVVLIEPDQNIFQPGSMVTLTALPTEGFRFTGWNGNIISSNNPLTLIMDVNKTIAPTFTPVWTLVTGVMGTGRVIREPDQSDYLMGTMVILTAIADGNYAFLKWTGDASGTSNPLTMFLNTNKTVSALFVPTFVLAVATNGSGVVSIVPQKDRYAEGEAVQLVGSAAAGFGFANWSESITSETDHITLTMDGDKALVAHFKLLRMLQTSVSGEGIISRKPDRTNYLDGDVVQLTAQAAKNWQFIEWTGSMSSTQSTVSVELDSDKELRASFKQLFTVTASHNGQGEVGLNPRQTQYLDGSIVHLSATSALGYRFASWAGDMLDTNNPAELLVDSNKIVVANFAPNWRLKVGRGGLAKDGFHLTLEGETGARYQLEFSSGLSSWIPLSTVTNAGGSIEILDPQARFLNRRFYRATFLP